jgi:hypothetical protein
MKKVIIAALVVTGFAAAAVAQDLNQGIGAKEVVSMAAQADLAVPAAPAAARVNYSRDCVRFTFGPEDSGALTDKIYLRSTQYETVCHTVMVPGPNGTQVPQQSCHEQPGMTWYEYGQIKMADRKLLPWEKESFEMCLQGPWLDLYVNAAGYRYTAERSGHSGFTLFTLTAHEKTPMKADEDGVNYAGFEFKDGKFVFKATDKWAKEYAGEKIAIKVELYKDNALFFDTFKGEKEFTFDAAASYEMAFTEDELSKPEADPADGMRGAKKYFLKWGFKRVGSISKDNFVKKDKTPAITK